MTSSLMILMRTSFQQKDALPVKWIADPEVAELGFQHTEVPQEQLEQETDIIKGGKDPVGEPGGILFQHPSAVKDQVCYIW